MNKFYLTTAIPYVNAAPHIGHALEFVQADVVARYHQLLGDQTALLTGSDENSLKNVQAAEKEGISTQELCDKNTIKFQELFKSLNINYQFFQRGSDKKTHFVGSQELWRRCKKEDIYKKNYEGLYCVGCETFYTEDELTKGKCPEHLTRPELVQEENYFFRLSKYQQQLEELISKDILKIIPETKKNEVFSFIKMGLRDFSISRSRERAKNWGVPVPGDDKQIIYVWFDALNIYQTGVGFGWNEKLYKKWWPADLHIIGKGIIRFHAVYWPAILLSAGLPLPKSIFVHGYLTVNGQKISKSLGNVIDPGDLIKKYGIDPLRYYLLREIPSYSDGDFSERRFTELYNADLANGLGNAGARVAKLCESSNFRIDRILPTFLSGHVNKEIENYRFDHALEIIWKDIKQLNEFLDREEPWKRKGEELRKTLVGAVSIIRNIAQVLQPFLPETAEKILKQFEGPTIKSESPLFPRIK